MRFRIRIRNIVLALGLLTVVLVMLPRQATGILLSPVQLFAPFQSIASRIVEGGRRVLGRSSHGADAVDSARLIAALENQVASQQARIQSLEQQNSVLAQYRRELSGSERLVSARVLSRDPVSWRSSLLLAAGSQRGVKSGASVVTQFFMDTGTESGIKSGMSVLAGEVLLGFVDQVEGGVSKVRLLNDLESRMAVRLGRVSENNVRLLDSRFWLTGSPTGQMFIRDVDHRYVESGDIRIGDKVMTQDDDSRLPVTVNIGEISAMQVQMNNHLLYDLEIVPEMPLEHVGQVYVVDVG